MIKDQLNAGRVDDVFAGLKPYRRRAADTIPPLRNPPVASASPCYQRVPKSGSAQCRRITRSRIRAAASAIRTLTDSRGV